MTQASLTFHVSGDLERAFIHMSVAFDSSMPTWSDDKFERFFSYRLAKINKFSKD